MALNPSERATTANSMMQILNNSGGDISQLTERVEVLEEEVPVIAAQTNENTNRIQVLEQTSHGLKVLNVITPLNADDIFARTVSTKRFTINATNFPELVEHESDLYTYDIISLEIHGQANNDNPIFFYKITDNRDLDIAAFASLQIMDNLAMVSLIWRSGMFGGMWTGKSGRVMFS